jgi:hypothetical protein
LNDFDYDCLQKKRLSRNALARKCGSKSKKCALPSDRLTPKQWRERNGNVVEINLNKPMSLDEFKQMKSDLQEEYIKHLVDTYGVNAISLGQVFGCNPNTVRKLIRENELNIVFRRGVQMPKENREAFKRFLAQGLLQDDTDTADEETEEPAHDQECDQIPPLVPVQPSDAMRMSSFSLRFDGPVDVNMIANSLVHILGENARGEIEIQCRLY